MKVSWLEPPRTFAIGRGEPIEMRDMGRVELAPDEQLTLTTPDGAEYDVARKSWGFYATPSTNARLASFGLRAALVASYVDKHYVVLVERGRDADFAAYLERERCTIVAWLDDAATLEAIRAACGPAAAPVASPSDDLTCPCGGRRLTTVHTYFERPAGEVVKLARADGSYRREIFRCSLCGHYLSFHDMIDPGFYEGAYVSATYGDAEGLRRTFERIVALPRDRSDNAGRVEHVARFARARFGEGATPSVLDVGSGLCVFLHGMKRLGFRCTALDPDARAAAHAREHVGVDAIEGDFFRVEPTSRFELVTLNKVLEHVRDPVAMLARAKAFLAPGGAIYVELPDGEGAAEEGFDREEFFVEHVHAFSVASLDRLAARAGLRTLSIERLREPSTKYTLRAFLDRPSPTR